MEFEAVRRFLPHGVRGSSAVLIVPTHVIQVRGPREWRRVSSPTSVLPLGLSGEREPGLGLEVLDIFPGNLIGRLRTFSFEPIVCRIPPAHDVEPLTLCHLVLGDQERTQGDHVDWSFVGEGVRIVVPPFRIRLLRPHPELSARKPHKHDSGLSVAVLEVSLRIPAKWGEEVEEANLGLAEPDPQGHKDHCDGPCPEDDALALCLHGLILLGVEALVKAGGHREGLW
jgi:hypothetical protein